MAAMKKNTQSRFLQIRVSKQFVKDVERAARKAKAPSVSEFCRLAIMAAAAKYGVEIRR